MENTSTSFNDFGLSAEILKAINELGFTSPSPIQAQTLPLLIGQETDCLALAATGTGKTAAFGLPLLERIDVKKRATQALILCPTRELALQVAGQIDLLGKYKGVRSTAVYGGASYRDQIFALQANPAIVVGTPGRVIDHLERGTLKLADVRTLVLDEADEMISMGFQEDLERIMSEVPRDNANIWLFSATMSPQIRQVADEYLRDPVSVHVNRGEMLSSTVEQFYYMVRESDKFEVLRKLIDANEGFYGLIFCQTKSLVTDLTQYLAEQGYKVDSLHGDKDQKAREKTMQAFRDKKIRVLVCTDVASRGLDVKDVTHVINYSLPRELDNYVHRIGRTARSGKTGVAMNLVTPAHRRLIGAIERLTRSRMKEGKIPTRREIGAKKVSTMLSTFTEQPYYSRAMELLDPTWMASLEGMSREEIAGRFLNMMLPEVFNERERGARIESYSAPAAPRRTEGNAPRASKFDSPRAARGPRPFRSERADFSDSERPSRPYRAKRADDRDNRDERSYPPRRKWKQDDRGSEPRSFREQARTRKSPRF